MNYSRALLVVLAGLAGGCNLALNAGGGGSAGGGSAGGGSGGGGSAGGGSGGGGSSTGGGSAVGSVGLGWITRMVGVSAAGVTAMENAVWVGGGFTNNAQFGLGESTETTLAQAGSSSFSGYFNPVDGGFRGAGVRAHSLTSTSATLQINRYAALQVGSGSTDMFFSSCLGEIYFPSSSGYFTGGGATIPAALAFSSDVDFWTDLGWGVAGMPLAYNSHLMVGDIPQGTVATFSGGATLTSAGGTDIFFERYASPSYWLQTFGSTADDHAVDVAAAPDAGTAVIAGSVGGVVNLGWPMSPTRHAGGTDGFLAKVDYNVRDGGYWPVGAVVWAKTFGGAGNDQPAAVALLSSQDVIAIGTFAGNASFGPNEPHSTLLACTAQEVTCPFLARFAGGTGSLVWAKKLPATLKMTALTVAGGDHVVVAGHLLGDATLSDGALSVLLAGSNGLAVAVFDAQGALLRASVVSPGPDEKQVIALSPVAGGDVVILGWYRTSMTWGSSVLTTPTQETFLGRLQVP